MAYFNWEDNTWVKYTVSGLVFFSPTNFVIFHQNNLEINSGNFIFIYIYKCKFNYNFFYFSGIFCHILDNCKKEKKIKNPGNTWVEE